MASKYLRKHTIPSGFREVLNGLTREILRNQPLDIIDFSCEYFRCLQEGIILDYAHKGENLPCDFKPTIPTLSRIELKIKPSKEDEQRYKNALEKAKQIVSFGSDGKEMLEEKNENEEDSQHGDEQLQEEQADENEEQQEQEQGEEEHEYEEQDEQQQETVSKKASEHGETDTNKEITSNKDKDEQLKTQSQLLNTEERFRRQLQETGPINTVDNESDKFFENCINFHQKEEILNSLRENPEVDKYITSYYENNKDINTLLITLQSNIINYFKAKANLNESDCEAIQSESSSKVEEIQSTGKLPILETNLTSLPLQEAISSFKQYDYYQRATLTYVTRLNNILQPNNPYLYEYAYFLLNPRLKSILSETNRETILASSPYIKEYFSKNIATLLPEVYFLVTEAEQINDNDFMKKYTALPVRIRELCQNFHDLYYYDNSSSPSIKQRSNLMEKSLYISSIPQLLEKLVKGPSPPDTPLIQTVTEKIQNNYDEIWGFISRVVNTPLELIENSYYDFMNFNNEERDIIIRFMGFEEDYAEVKEQLSKIEIDETSSNFMNKMRSYYVDYNVTNQQDIKDIILCYFNSNEYQIPNDVNDYLKQLLSEDNGVDVVEMFNKYKEFNALDKDGVYYYLWLFQKMKENEKVSELISSIEKEKNLREAASFNKRIEVLAENFTPDSDEFVMFMEQFKEWKGKLNNNKVIDFFELSDEEKENYFKNELNNEEKITVVNVLKSEAIYEGDDSEKNALLDTLIQFVPVDKEELGYDIQNYIGNGLMEMIQHNQQGDE